MSASRGKSLLYDPKARSIFFQVLLLVAIVVLVIIALGNAGENLESQGKEFSFAYLTKPAPGAIATSFGTWLLAYVPDESPIWVAYLVGIANTLIIAAAGILTATVLGTFLGVFRLSSNFILRSFATLYIETLRNIPLLLQILFWMKLSRLILPRGKKVADSAELIPGAVYVNSDGIRIPYMNWQVGSDLFFFMVIVVIIIAYLVFKHFRKLQEMTGKIYPRTWIALAVFALGTVIAFYIAGKPMYVELPTEIANGTGLKKGAFDASLGGLIVPEFLGLFIALSTYTASFIAEIVRAGILSVNKGQTEASKALGITNGVTLNKVILPQAMRVIIPPMTSQYLNLTKNSSLATVVGYIDFVAIADRIRNKEGVEVESILIIIAVYFTISLITSIIMNWVNNRMKLEER